MFDVEDLVEDGYSLDLMLSAIERAMLGLSGMNSKEAKYLLNILESMHDDIELYE